MNIIKRNGTITEFDSQRIKTAIMKSMKYGSGIIREDIADRITINCKKNMKERNITPTIFMVEEFIVNELIKEGQIEAAKAYEGYKEIQKFKREVNTTDEGILGLIQGTNEDSMKENSNKNPYVAPTQRDLIAGEVSRDIARRRLIPTYIVQAHDEGILHYHDMDYAISPIFNCCLINLEDMLNNGTVINDKLVETPKSFETACTITTQIIAQVASGQYGGQSITISHLAPFLRKSFDRAIKELMEDIQDKELVERLAYKRMRKALKDGVQTIRYQLSTLMTTNGQSPFVTIYLEINEGSEYEKEEALICEEMIRQRLEGMKNYKGQEIGEAFPKLIYALDECNCLEGGKYDYITKLCAECSAVRLVPDYQSKKIMRKNYEGNAFPPMGCRSHLSPWKDKEGKYKWYGRFNQGVVSINLPQIGILANGDMDLFWKIFEQRLELCKDALMVRHNLLKDTTSNISPIHFQYGAIARLDKNEKINKLLYDGYSTISLGYVGLYELTQAMLNTTHTSKEGEKFALEVMKYMENKCEEWKKETGLGFGLYGTPAESLIYRFCKLDRQKFGIIPNVTDKEYYNNSYHVAVTEEIDAFSKLKFESQFHDISLGGCISYIEVPDMTKNIKAVENIINYIYHNVQYAEINTKPDVCYVCGFKGEMQNNDNLEWYCPNCGNKDESEMQVMRRTCGYIGTNFWNKGRTIEIKNRVIHL